MKTDGNTLPPSEPFRWLTPGRVLILALTASLGIIAWLYVALDNERLAQVDNLEEDLGRFEERVDLTLIQLGQALNGLITLVEERTQDGYTARQAAADQETLTVLIDNVTERLATMQADLNALDTRVRQIEIDHDVFRNGGAGGQ